MSNEQVCRSLEILIAAPISDAAFIMLNCVAATLLMDKEDQEELILLMENYSRKKLEKILKYESVEKGQNGEMN